MKNTLMAYLSKRLKQDSTIYQQPPRPPGPVICISREVGCGGVNIARLLAIELEKPGTCKKWKVLSKEILEESARELNMNPNKLRHYLKEGDHSLFDDILSALSEKKHVSDRKIINTLIDLVTSVANDGYCIIVGRGGHIITRNIQRSLSVKLVAPINWRIKSVMEKFNFNIREAADFIEKTEIERENFLRHLGGDNYKDYGFDLTINLSKLNITEVIRLIKYAAQTKGLLEENTSKVEVF